MSCWETQTQRKQKFIQSLDWEVYDRLAKKAEERGVSLQEFVRAVVIPEWLRLESHGQKTVMLHPRQIGRLPLTREK